MLERSRFIGRLAAVTQLMFAVFLGGIASLSFEPGVISRGMVVAFVFSLPAVVGYIGTTARRPALLGAAGLSSLIGSLVAFSGVTLIFLVPAALFLYATVAGLAAPRSAGRRRWRSAVAQFGIAAAIVVLLVGAGASGLLITDSGCWTATRTPKGVHMEALPYSGGPLTVPLTGDSGGCSTGLISLRGSGLSALLGGSALVLAIFGARRRERDAPRAEPGRAV